jgi:hypothetical protein
LLEFLEGFVAGGASRCGRCGKLLLTPHGEVE